MTFGEAPCARRYWWLLPLSFQPSRVSLCCRRPMPRREERHRSAFPLRKRSRQGVSSASARSLFCFNKWAKPARSPFRATGSSLRREEVRHETIDFAAGGCDRRRYVRSTELRTVNLYVGNKLRQEHHLWWC